MGASRRQKQSGAALLLEGGTVGGAALGLYAASSRLMHHPVRPAPCPSSREAATCIGHATNLAVEPMALGAAAGAVMGLILALVLVLLWRGMLARLTTSRA